MVTKLRKTMTAGLREHGLLKETKPRIDVAFRNHAGDNHPALIRSLAEIGERTGNRDVRRVTSAALADFVARNEKFMGKKGPNLKPALNIAFKKLRDR